MNKFDIHTRRSLPYIHLGPKYKNRFNNNHVVEAVNRSNCLTAYWLFMYLRSGIKPRKRVPNPIKTLLTSEYAPLYSIQDNCIAAA